MERKGWEQPPTRLKVPASHHIGYSVQYVDGISEDLMVPPGVSEKGGVLLLCCSLRSLQIEPAFGTSRKLVANIDTNTPICFRRRHWQASPAPASVLDVVDTLGESCSHTILKLREKIEWWTSGRQTVRVGPSPRRLWVSAKPADRIPSTNVALVHSFAP